MRRIEAGSGSAVPLSVDAEPDVISSLGDKDVSGVLSITPVPLLIEYIIPGSPMETVSGCAPSHEHPMVMCLIALLTDVRLEAAPIWA